MLSQKGRPLYKMKKAVLKKRLVWRLWLLLNFKASAREKKTIAFRHLGFWQVTSKKGKALEVYAVSQWWWWWLLKMLSPCWCIFLRKSLPKKFGANFSGAQAPTKRMMVGALSGLTPNLENETEEKQKTKEATKFQTQSSSRCCILELHRDPIAPFQ